MHDIQVPIDIQAALPRSSIRTATIELSVAAGIASDSDAMVIAGAAMAALYIAPENAESLFSTEHRVPLGRVLIGTGEANELRASLDEERITTLSGGPILLGVEFRDIALEVVTPPHDNTTLYGITYAFPELALSGRAAQP